MGGGNSKQQVHPSNQQMRNESIQQDQQDDQFWQDVFTQEQHAYQHTQQYQETSTIRPNRSLSALPEARVLQPSTSSQSTLYNPDPDAGAFPQQETTYHPQTKGRVTLDPKTATDVQIEELKRDANKRNILKKIKEEKTKKQSDGCCVIL